jgi:hypothetical protein
MAAIAARWTYQVIEVHASDHDEERTLREWGADGWELVAVVPSPRDARSIVQYLKKPLPPEPEGEDY